MGYVAFFAVPVLLWLIGTAWIKVRPRDNWFATRAVAYVVGSDNRLSLSRLQAFAWTMIIFGSYAAATLVHEPYSALDSTTAQLADSVAQAANARVTTVAALAATARTQLESSRATLRAAEVAAVEARAVAAELARADTTSGPARAALDSARQRERTAAATLAARLATIAVDSLRVLSDSAAAVAAARSARDADNEASRHRWIEIPATLLALAGISLGAGVFSSLISSASGEDKTACVTALRVHRYDEVEAMRIVGLGVADAPDSPCVLLHGTDLGASGRVRFGSLYADVLHWRNDGRLVLVEVPNEYLRRDAGAPPLMKLPASRHGNRLTVETPNGKLVYELRAEANGLLALGSAVTSFEFVDLFRDDKNPVRLDLMKFQMFGWTIIAIAIYAWTFMRALSPTLRSLPAVDDSLVILTGLSQTGYLTSKAVSTVGVRTGDASALQSTPTADAAHPQSLLPSPGAVIPPPLGPPPGPAPR